MDNLAERIDVKSRAKRLYDTIEAIWPDTDTWSAHTKDSISGFLHLVIKGDKNVILNAGSGGNDYGLMSNGVCVNLDISIRHCRSLSHAVVGDIEAIPFADASFNVVVCVGAILNYCEPYVCLPELFRVATTGGMVLLDFETTATAEILFSSHWGKRVSVVERNYAGRMDKTFLFSADHIRRIVETCGGNVVRTKHYHVATALWRRLTPEGPIPNIVLLVDKLASRMSAVKTLSSNIIFACRKH
jgi:hypothetical protein